jgi:hypothetical protein
MVGSFTNDDLERMWKRAIMTGKRNFHFKYLHTSKSIVTSNDPEKKEEKI